jgi:RNA polymerase sigma-70 factor (ECF subfamily)
MPSDPDLERRVAERLSAGALDQATTLALEGYGLAVLGYLRSMLDEDDAQDAFSSFAEAVWRGLPGFRGEGTLRAWLFQLAWHSVTHLVRDPYRRRGRHLPTSAASRLAVRVASTVRIREERSDRLRELRASLDPDDRTLLVLRLDRELEWEEIAAVLSSDAAPVTAAALRKRFERLKARLAQVAREQGLLD